MNCKLKLPSKGFYQQNSLKKILQTLALVFPLRICLQYFPGNLSRQDEKNFNFTNKCIENFQKRYQCMWLHVTPSNFFSGIVRSEALQFIFFSEQPFYGNYSTLDSHTNTVISHAVAYSLRQLPVYQQPNCPCREASTIIITSNVFSQKQRLIISPHQPC